MRAVLKYPGSKWNIASQLVEMIPEHHSYVETFFGSGAVLFNKPVSDIETINDLSHDVVNLFRCIQEDVDRLAAMVMTTPFSREKYEDTYKLSLSIQRHICPNNDPRIYWAREVTFDYGTMNAVRVDFMKFKPVNNTVSGIEKGDFYCYEVKSSVEDFRSKNGHNFLGDYNYYVMPEEVYEQIKKEIPYHVGVYVPDGMNYQGEWYNLKAIKKAKRKDRSRPVSEMLLMMFRSAARDRRQTK